MAIGCVTTGKYEAKVADYNQALAREQQLRDQVADLQRQLADSRKKYDEAAAVIGQLKDRLTQLGQNVDQLSSERGQLAAGLQDAQTRLEELRKQKAAAEARAQVFRTLIDKLRSMIDAGQLKVTIRNGRMLIVLPNDVLFDSGRTDLKPAGKSAVTQVAKALATIGDRRFLVSGHTDNVPIKTSRFPSNWELSTARAVEVARLLVAGRDEAARCWGRRATPSSIPWPRTTPPEQGAEPADRDHPGAQPVGPAEPRHLVDGEQGEMTVRHRRPRSLAVLGCGPGYGQRCCWIRRRGPEQGPTQEGAQAGGGRGGRAR